MSRKVNTFLVGAAKSGTTSIHDYLSRSKDVCVGKSKEPNFFCSDIQTQLFSPSFNKHHPLNYKGEQNRHSSWTTDIDCYESLFKSYKQQKIIVDSSVSYLYSSLAAMNIKNYNEKAKVIIVLRDPVTRFISHYKMNQQIAIEPRKLKTVIENEVNQKSRNMNWGGDHLYFQLGHYHAQVKRYLEIFEPQNLLILPFEMIKENEEGFYRKICNFLNIPFLELSKNNCSNQSKVNRFPALYKIMSKFSSNYIPISAKSFIKELLLKNGIEEIDSEDIKTLQFQYLKPNEKLQRLFNNHSIKFDFSFWESLC